MFFTPSLPAWALLALASLSSARRCTDLTVEVPVVARNAFFNIRAPTNNIEVTDFILNYTRQGYNFTNDLLQGYSQWNKAYNVFATYCEPDKGPSDTVQLLTHGIGFDRGYWDVDINDFNYSYTQVANDEYGYSTFAWDRLGIGRSEHGHAFNEIQSFLEIGALNALTQQLRNGSIKGISKSFNKVVHVGHSFGSILSYSLEVLHPNASDGLVLTGFSHVSEYKPYFALGSNFVLAKSLEPFKDYEDGYLANGSPSGVQTDYFATGSFDPALLDLAVKWGKPVAIGELLTFAGASTEPNPLKGPVMIITGGESDSLLVKPELKSRYTDIPQNETSHFAEEIALRQGL
ncbi:hypothetical protein DHEL01_v211339 [Diaporthe helianthi]|uniref:AB hydrolase-1 domain-containing protein n=1 Tax=Diaporthe helianthi TaxID=158607 RepID=A0A2P5HJ45_DIAHE|nr:hypothetical protein DHEL01_v211339 [Diaporthe helianthi]